MRCLLTPIISVKENWFSRNFSLFASNLVSLKKRISVDFFMRLRKGEKYCLDSWPGKDRVLTREFTFWVDRWRENIGQNKRKQKNKKYVQICFSSSFFLFPSRFCCDYLLSQSAVDIDCYVRASAGCLHFVYQHTERGERERGFVTD